jgi:hypothetical protein
MEEQRELHMPVLSNSSTTRRALRTAAVTGALIVTTLFSAAAQQVALTPQQCSDAISVAAAIVQRNSGKLSQSMIDSFVQFGKSKCDLGTNFVRENAADNDAFKEFRLKLIAMRTAALTQPQALAKK